MVASDSARGYAFRSAGVAVLPVRRPAARQRSSSGRLPDLEPASPFAADPCGGATILLSGVSSQAGAAAGSAGRQPHPWVASGRSTARKGPSFLPAAAARVRGLWPSGLPMPAHGLTVVESARDRLAAAIALSLRRQPNGDAAPAQGLCHCAPVRHRPGHAGVQARADPPGQGPDRRGRGHQDAGARAGHGDSGAPRRPISEPGVRA